MSFESDYWGDCCNTFDEDQKHYVYARFMGLDRQGYSFYTHGKAIVDIGGGPTSMLLKTKGLHYGVVIDPLEYPAWTYERYKTKGIECKIMRGEDFQSCGYKENGEVYSYDECWIYNCLQHTDDPFKIIQNAKTAARVLRLFEWIDIPAHEGHPHELTKANLDKWIGCDGNVVELAESGCYGRAYYVTTEV